MIVFFSMLPFSIVDPRTRLNKAVLKKGGHCVWLFGYFLGEGWWGRINPIYQKSHASGNYNRTYGIFTTCIAQVSLKEENRKIEKRPCPIICNTQALSLESDRLRDQRFNLQFCFLIAYKILPTSLPQHCFFR